MSIKPENEIDIIQQNIKILNTKIDMLFGRQELMDQSSVKSDPTTPHQLILERAVGGYVITIGRTGTRIVCSDITRALLSLADYCEETVVVNGQTNENEEEDD